MDIGLITRALHGAVGRVFRYSPLTINAETSPARIGSPDYEMQ
ncbi:hypothetical protein [Xanthomonas arboricola]|nr:hypothetical protein [Xanthomonas arboricola]SOT98653.1 hypothetical protein CFBP6762_02000 [Xanthomonas arboricola pv. fragariae]